MKVTAEPKNTWMLLCVVHPLWIRVNLPVLFWKQNKLSVVLYYNQVILMEITH
jgi:hypothetical protein